MKSTTSEDSRKTLAARAPWESEVQGESGRPRVAPRKRQSGAPRKRDGERTGPGARGAVPRRPEFSVGWDLNAAQVRVQGQDRGRARDGRLGVTSRLHDEDSVAGPRPRAPCRRA